jgi:hypothetical protein
MVRVPAFLALALSPLLIGATAPQQAPAAQEQDIVVSGQRRIAPAAARHFVHDIATTREDQLARFNQPVCPMVIGLPAQYAGMVVERIRDIARRSGAGAAPAKCRPNLALIVAENADDLVAGLRAHSTIFAGLDRVEIERAMRKGPVHVWHRDEILNEDGIGVGHPTGGESGGGSFDTLPTLQVRHASIVDLPTIQAMTGAIIVVDADALIGKTLFQIADYVTMRTLGGARPPAGGTSDTILTLFDAGAMPPPGATFLDITYLDALYHTEPNTNATMQMTRIAQRIVRDSSPDAARK